MRTLVTGGAGFIGSNLIHQIMAETNHEGVNLYKPTYAGDQVTISGPL